MFRSFLARMVCCLLAVWSGTGLGAEGEHDCHSCEETSLSEDLKRLASRLHGRGFLEAEYLYTGEVFTNTHGGINTNKAIEYRGNFDLVITADLDQAKLAPGGIFVIYGQNGHGRGLTERHVGDWQVLSNIDAWDFAQVSEYWWQRGLWDDRVTVRVGKQDVNDAFAVVEMAGDFINSSFGFHPTIPMPTFPDPSMGAAVFFEVTERVTFEAGVWDGIPDGRNWGFSGTGITFSTVELSVDYHLGGNRSLPGSVHAGSWYHSGPWDDLTPGSTRIFTGNHGMHLEAQQILLPEACRDTDEETAQGLGGFFQYGWSPQDRTVPHQYFGGGLSYTGLLCNRDADVLGLGVAHLLFSDRLGDLPPETAIELFYKARITERVILQPDLQYIAHPSGQYRDALAFGLRFEVTL